MAVAAAIASARPRPIAPVPPEDWPTRRQRLRRPHRFYNQIELYPRRAYDAKILTRTAGPRFLVLLSDPDAVRHVLQTNAANYTKLPQLLQRVGPLLGRGLLTAEGEDWRRHRRILAPAFRQEALEAMLPDMAAAGHALVARWEGRRGRPLAVFAEMARVTLTVVVRTMFAQALDRRAEAVAASVHRYVLLGTLVAAIEAVGLPGRLSAGLLGLLGPAMAAPLNRYSERLAQWSREAGEAASLPLRLLERARRGADGGDPLTEQEVRDEIATLLIAGHETTATALAWLWYLLDLHPWARARLEAELAAVLGGRDPTAADLPHLVYTRMVIDEAMRLYPPVPGLGRRSLAADELAGERIPPGAEISIIPWILHRHRALWQEPDLFDPERFAPERKAALHRFAYLPFGGGPRICIGASLATMELLTIVAIVAQRYRLRLLPGQRFEPVAAITLRPRPDIRMVLERR